MATGDSDTTAKSFSFFLKSKDYAIIKAGAKDYSEEQNWPINRTSRTIPGTRHPEGGQPAQLTSAWLGAKLTHTCEAFSQFKKAKNKNHYFAR